MNDYSKSIILIPTLNEKENLKVLIPAIFGLLPDVSILIVDDNSTDGTQELIDSLMNNFKKLFILKRKTDFGYGRSSIDGFRWALERSYENVVTMDADFSHDFSEVPVLFEKLNGFDVIVGSRYVKGGGIRNWGFPRRVLSKFANFYVKAILRLPVADVTTGFNAYRLEAVKKVDLKNIKSDGYAFLVELKYRIFKAGCKFFEYPILFSERRGGQSKMSAGIIWESIWLPWKMKLKKS